MKTIERLDKYLEAKGVLPIAFEKACKMSNGSYAKQLNKKGSISSHLLERIAKVYPDLNLTWLITGKGYMVTKTTGSTKEDVLATQKLEEEQAAYKAKSKAVELIQEGLDILQSTMKNRKR